MAYANRFTMNGTDYIITPTSTAQRYDSASSYSVGDYVYYDDTLYCCVADATGAFDSDKWEAVTVGEVLTDVNAELADVNDELTDAKADLTDLYQNKADIIVSSASGSIAHFEDGAAYPVKELVAHIGPVQDLHGYDNPWPAGGGKNKLNPSVLATKTSGDVTFTPKSDAIVSLSGTSTGNMNYYICPTGSNVVKSNAGYVLPAGTYTFSARKADGSPIGLSGAIGMFYWEGSSDTRQIVQLNNNNVISASVTSAETLYITPVIGGIASVVTDFDVYLQLESGSSATSWAPYSNPCPISGHTGCDIVVSPTEDAEDGTTYPITWQTEAGTVYGGTLTINYDESADLVADTALWTNNTANMNNSEDYPGWASSGIKELIDTAESGVVNNAMTNFGTEWSYNTIGSNDILFLSKSHYGKTQTEWKALAMDVQIVVNLATPITYHLTNIDQIEILFGTNNVWTTANGDTDVTYCADTKLYIEQLTKPTEDDMTANTTIQSGKFFMVGNRLFVSTSTIASGDTINPGTNCTELSLADALNTL